MLHLRTPCHLIEPPACRIPHVQVYSLLLQAVDDLIAEGIAPDSGTIWSRWSHLVEERVKEEEQHLCSVRDGNQVRLTAVQALREQQMQTNSSCMQCRLQLARSGSGRRASVLASHCHLHPPPALLSTGCPDAGSGVPDQAGPEGTGAGW